MQPSPKNELIQDIINLIEDILRKNTTTTFFIIDEIDKDSWGGVAGHQVAELRKK